MIVYLIGCVLTFVCIMAYCYFWSKTQTITIGDVVIGLILSVFSWVTLGVWGVSWLIFSIDFDKVLIKKNKKKNEIIID